jgi:hypothetical protein
MVRQTASQGHVYQTVFGITHQRQQQEQSKEAKD